MEEDLATLATEFKDHALKDEANQVENILQFGAIHDRLDLVATKEDIADLKSVLKAVRVGTGIFSYSYNNAAKIGSFILFLIAIVGVIKYGVWGAAIWFFKLMSGNL